MSTSSSACMTCRQRRRSTLPSMTKDENIEPICMQGLDPSRRGTNGWQLYGKGEYFHTVARLANLFCEQGTEKARMVIFAVVVDGQSARIQNSGVICATDSSQHIPLGVLEYDRSTSSTAAYE